MTSPDFHLADHGSIAILTPITRAAEEWVSEHLDAPTSWGKGVVIEPRYVADIVLGLQSDGLSIS